MGLSRKHSENKRPANWRGGQRGFVLLWSLSLLVLCAVVLIAVARRSARRAAEAVDAQDQLQLKWALASCRRVLPRHAEELLRMREKKLKAPQAQMELTWELDGLQLDLQLSDEQAKVNLNTVYTELGKQRTAAMMRQLLSRNRSGLKIALNPDPRAVAAERNEKKKTDGKSGTGAVGWGTGSMGAAAMGQSAGSMGTSMGQGVGSSDQAASDVESTSEELPVPMFGCWDQVFDSSEVTALLATAEGSPSLLDLLSCWGNGRLNVRRASPEVVTAVLGSYIQHTQIQRLLQMRKQRPDDNIAAWLAACELSTEQRQALSRWTTSRSSCHSLMIHVSGSGQNRYEMVAWEDAARDDSAKETAATQPSPATDELQTQNDPARVYRLVW